MNLNLPTYRKNQQENSFELSKEEKRSFEDLFNWSKHSEESLKYKILENGPIRYRIT